MKKIIYAVLVFSTLFSCERRFNSNPTPSEFCMVIKFTQPEYKNLVLAEHENKVLKVQSYTQLHSDCDWSLFQSGNNYIELHDDYLLVYPYDIVYFDYGPILIDKYPVILNKGWNKLDGFSFQNEEILDEMPLKVQALFFYDDILYLNGLLPEESRESLSQEAPLDDIYYKCDMTSTAKAYRDSICAIYVRILNQSIDNGHFQRE